jgi:ABC-type Fe3+ transport system permease subunit
MSNMVVIPQLVLIVAMINIFGYNSYGTPLSSVWWLSLAIIFTGIIALSIFFVRAIQQMVAKNK